MYIKQKKYIQPFKHETNMKQKIMNQFKIRLVICILAIFHFVIIKIQCFEKKTYIITLL